MHYWETEHDGAMICAGVGGPLTGKGSNVLIIDDPVKNSEEANSLTMRDKAWDWWTSTARTRLEPSIDPNTGEKVQPAVIIMATRWHSDDLIGRLLIFTRQMDMLMTSEAGVEAVAQNFLQGNYSLDMEAIAISSPAAGDAQ